MILSGKKIIHEVTKEQRSVCSGSMTLWGDGMCPGRQACLVE